VLVFGVLFTAACGRVGAPQPPFIRVPEPITDLTVTQSGHDLVLSWTNPPRYVDGSAATNLARIQIHSDGSTLASVPITTAGQVQSYKTPAGQVESGERTFTAIVETAQGKVSGASNPASIAPVEVPGRVSGFTAVADQRRIFLKWNPPEDHPEVADAYAITRTDLPAEVETVTGTTFEDTRYVPGREFTYQITALRRAGGRLVMGVGPEQVTVVASDKTPPGAPAGLEITQSILTWEPNPELDIAGYRVFRSDRPDGGFKAVTDQPIPTTIYTDASYEPGAYYRVSAVDESENESPMSAPLRAP